MRSHSLDELRSAWPSRVLWRDVRKAEPTVLRQAWRGTGLGVLAILATLLTTALTIEWPVRVDLPQWIDWARGLFIIVGLFTAILLWVFAAILISFPADTRRSIAFERFAREAGLNYSRFGLAPPRRGVFFGEQLPGPREQLPARALSLTSAPAPLFQTAFVLRRGADMVQPPVQIGVASYSGSKSDPRGPRNSFRFLSLQLSRPLPHLMIDAKGNGRLRAILPGVQKLSLEGDFDRFFTVYVPRGYERDALELLTPDVMVCLIDHGRAWDLEVVDDRLLLASPKVTRWSDREQTTALLRFAEIVESELGHQAATYSDPRAARPRIAVAAAGRRLRRRSGIWLVLALTIAVAAMMGAPFVLGWFLDR